jgi:hypothetical protein
MQKVVKEARSAMPYYQTVVVISVKECSQCRIGRIPAMHGTSIHAELVDLERQLSDNVEQDNNVKENKQDIDSHT